MVTVRARVSARIRVRASVRVTARARVTAKVRVRVIDSPRPPLAHTTPRNLQGQC